MQQFLAEGAYTGRFSALQDYFIDNDLDLADEILSRFEKATKDNPVNIADICCGAGIAAEDLASWPEQLYGQEIDDLEIIDSEAYKKINVTGIDLKVHPEIVAKDLHLNRQYRERVLSKELHDKHPEWKYDNLYPENLRIRKEFPKQYAKLINGDAKNIPLDSNSQDVVYSSAGLMYIDNSLKVFEEIYRILKPGGIAMISSITGREGVSRSPSFDEIISQTHGASDVISFQSNPFGKFGRYTDKGVFIIKKSEDDVFDGKFNYEFLRTHKSFTPGLVDWEHYAVTADYARIS